MRTLLAGAACLTLVAGATEANAHAHLVSANPTANATVLAPRVLSLSFSEQLKPQFSGLTIIAADARHSAAPAKVDLSKDRRVLVAVPSRPLAKGVYKIMWHAVSADTHRVQGAYSFTVR